MKIRLASLDDTPVLTFLRDERHVLLQQAAPRLRDYPVRLEFPLLLDMPGVRVFIASDDPEDRVDPKDRVVGYIAAALRPLDSSVRAPTADAGFVLELVLDAHRYHAGMGRALYRAAADWLREEGQQTCLVRVPRFHVVEQAFWRSLGAVEVTTEDDPTSGSRGWAWMKLP